MLDIKFLWENVHRSYINSFLMRHCVILFSSRNNSSLGEKKEYSDCYSGNEGYFSVYIWKNFTGKEDVWRVIIAQKFLKTKQQQQNPT